MRTFIKSLVLSPIAVFGLLAGCSQSVGPGGVQQDAGPFHQSVGPGGVSQGMGGGVPSRTYQTTGGAPPRVGSNDCEISCGGRSYIANCPSDSQPVCQCSSTPYAGCLAPSR